MNTFLKIFFHSKAYAQNAHFKRNEIDWARAAFSERILSGNDDNSGSANRYGCSEIYNSHSWRVFDKPTCRRYCVIDGARMSRYNGNARERSLLSGFYLCFIIRRGSRKSWIHNSRFSLLNITTTRYATFNYRHRCRYAFTCWECAGVTFPRYTSIVCAFLHKYVYSLVNKASL